MKRLILTLFILLAVAGPGWAATYIMRIDGGAATKALATATDPTDTANCLSLAGYESERVAHPFVAGDIIYVSSLGGSFVGAGANNTVPILTVQQGITIQNWTGDNSVVFDCNAGSGAGKPYLVGIQITDSANTNYTATLSGFTIQNAGAGALGTPVANSKCVDIYGLVTANLTSMTLQNTGASVIYQNKSANGRPVVTATNCTMTQAGGIAVNVACGTFNMSGGSLDYCLTGVDNAETDIVNPYANGPFITLTNATFSGRQGATGAPITTSCVTTIDGCTINYYDNTATSPTGVVCVNAHFTPAQWVIKNSTINFKSIGHATIGFSVPTGTYYATFGPNNAIVDDSTTAFSTGITNKSNLTFTGSNSITSCNMGIDIRKAQTYNGLTLTTCTTGLNFSVGDNSIIDSCFFKNCTKGIYTNTVPFVARNSIFVVPTGTKYGIHCQGTTGHATLQNLTMRGGGTKTGTGIYFQSASETPTVTNVILANLAVGINSAANYTYTTCDFYDNTTARSGAGTATDGGGNITGDPLFANAGGSYALATDFKLQSTSPCINVGTTIVGLTTDYEGAARPQ